MVEGQQDCTTWRTLEGKTMKDIQNGRNGSAQVRLHTQSEFPI